MHINKIEEYFKIDSLIKLSDNIKNIIVILLPICMTGFWLLVKTTILSKYPEVFSENFSASQLIIIFLFYTSILALMCISPGILSLLINSEINTKKTISIQIKI